MSSAEIPSHEEMLKFLRESIKVAKRAMTLNHHPFGSVLVGPEGEILLSQCNYSPVHHAESELARVANTNFTPDYLYRCVLYTSVEPCAMCTGSIYWANIGTIVYAMPESKLHEFTAGSRENPTLGMPCREVLKHATRKIRVIGPFPQLEEEVAEDHRNFWTTH
ncbi:CMP/dCMP deaminase, zinc-binding protein [Dichotomocladium elegans]|nr:CMP/dCMP deaminase, zinc-binding protein [Dichotomocladium elegans]